MPRAFQGTAAFPNHVRAERETAGLTQADLADRTGIERPWLSRIENGEALCTPQQLDAIAEALQISVARLYEADWLKVVAAARKAQDEGK